MAGIGVSISLFAVVCLLFKEAGKSATYYKIMLLSE